MAKGKSLKRDETPSLISADKVSGTSVHTPAGEKVGSIENVMIDKQSGHVEYAVLAFGGMLGMGQSRRALPWNVLQYDTDQNAYVVNIDPEMLKEAPDYEDDDDAVTWSDPEWRRRVDEYYEI
jgi:sporulation protein YlmC with PRC-barrel domain